MTTPGGQRVNCLNGFCEDHRLALYQGHRALAEVAIRRLPGTANPDWNWNSPFIRVAAPD